MNKWWFFFFALHGLAYQVKGQSSYLSTGIGYGSHSLQDPLINYYNYAGQGLLNARIGGQLALDKYLLQFEGTIAEASLAAQNSDQKLYDFNYADMEVYDLKIRCLRELWPVGSHVIMNFGLGYQASLLMQEQRYANVLYDYASGYRKSFAFTPAAISVEINGSYQISDRQILSLQAGYFIVGCLRRPSDNYVKQIGAAEDPNWMIVSLRDFLVYRVSMEYNCFVSKSIAVYFRAETNYQQLKGDYQYAIRNNFLLVGVKKTFK